MQRGPLLEQIIADFTSRVFMKDFVVTNPKYYRGGQEKELTDLLLLLGDTCVVVSVKGTDGKPKSKTKLKRWLAKKTSEGLKQAKGGINWLSKVSFMGKDLWGDIKEFHPGSLRPTCGMVLLECPQRPYSAIEFDAQTPQSDIPLHYLSLDDFLNIVQLSGSIWDVFHYLRQRAEIRDMFTGINQEHPIFAYYSLRSHDLTGILSLGKSELADLAGFHAFHRTKNRQKYEERDKLAAHVNAIVYQLHTRHTSMEDFMPAELAGGVEPADQRVAYLKMAHMLNALPMSQKVWIGRELEQRLSNLRGSGNAGCLAIKPEKSELVFVFGCFSRMSRTERIRWIDKMLPAALYRHKVSEGLAIGIDADSAQTGYDLIWIPSYTGFTADDRKLAELIFPENEGPVVANPFGHARPYRQDD